MYHVSPFPLQLAADTTGAPPPARKASVAVTSIAESGRRAVTLALIVRREICLAQVQRN
jgi:hypothetical protein